MNDKENLNDIFDLLKYSKYQVPTVPTVMQRIKWKIKRYITFQKSNEMQWTDKELKIINNLNKGNKMEDNISNYYLDNPKVGDEVYNYLADTFETIKKISMGKHFAIETNRNYYTIDGRFNLEGGVVLFKSKPPFFEVPEPKKKIKIAPYEFVYEPDIFDGKKRYFYETTGGLYKDDEEFKARINRTFVKFRRMTEMEIEVEEDAI